MWNSHTLDLNTPSEVKNWVAVLKSKPQNKLNLFKAICLMKIGKSTYSIHVNLLDKFTFAKCLDQLRFIKVSFVFYCNKEVFLLRVYFNNFLKLNTLSLFAMI